MVIIPEVFLTNPQVLTIFPPQEPFVPIIRDYIIAHWIGLNLKGTKLIGADHLAVLRDIAFSPEKYNIFLVPQFGSITVEEGAEYVIGVQQGEEVAPKAQRLATTNRASKLPGIQSRRSKVFALPNGIQTIMGAMINTPYLAVDARHVRNTTLQGKKSGRPDIPVVGGAALTIKTADTVDPDNVIFQWSQILGSAEEAGDWFRVKEKGKVEVKPISRHSINKRKIGMEVVLQDPALHSFSSTTQCVADPTVEDPDNRKEVVVTTELPVNSEVNAFTLEIGLQPGAESGLPTLVEDVPADTDGDQKGDEIKKLSLDILAKFLGDRPDTITLAADFAQARRNALDVANNEVVQWKGAVTASTALFAFNAAEDDALKEAGPIVTSEEALQAFETGLDALIASAKIKFAILEPLPIGAPIKSEPTVTQPGLWSVTLEFGDVTVEVLEGRSEIKIDINGGKNPVLVRPSDTGAGDKVTSHSGPRPYLLTFIPVWNGILFSDSPLVTPLTAYTYIQKDSELSLPEEIEKQLQKGEQDRPPRFGKNGEFLPLFEGAWDPAGLQTAVANGEAAAVENAKKNNWPEGSVQATQAFTLIETDSTDFQNVNVGDTVLGFAGGDFTVTPSRTKVTVINETTDFEGFVISRSLTLGADNFQSVGAGFRVEADPASVFAAGKTSISQTLQSRGSDDLRDRGILAYDEARTAARRAGKNEEGQHEAGVEAVLVEVAKGPQLLGLEIPDDAKAHVSFGDNLNVSFERCGGSVQFKPVYFTDELRTHYLHVGRAQVNKDQPPGKDADADKEKEQIKFDPRGTIFRNPKVACSFSVPVFYRNGNNIKLRSGDFELLGKEVPVDSLSTSIQRLQPGLRRPVCFWGLYNYLVEDPENPKCPGVRIRNREGFLKPSDVQEPRIKRISVSRNLDGTSGSLVWDRFGPSGYGFRPPPNAGRLRLAVVGGVDTLPGVIYTGIGMGNASKDSADSDTIEITLYGREVKMTDAGSGQRLINVPFFDGYDHRIVMQYLSDYAGVGFNDNRTRPYKLPAGDLFNDRQSVVDFKTGTPVWDAIAEVQKLAATIAYFDRFGTLQYFEVGQTRVRNWIYPVKLTVSVDDNPDLTALKNTLVVAGLVSTVKGNPADNLFTPLRNFMDPPDERLTAVFELVNPQTEPEFEWDKMGFYVIPGVVKPGDIKREAARLQRLVSRPRAVGSVTVPGNAEIELLDVFNRFWTVTGITHDVDVDAKTWTTSVQVELLVGLEFGGGFPEGPEKKEQVDDDDAEKAKGKGDVDIEQEAQDISLNDQLKIGLTEIIEQFEEIEGQ